MLFKFYKKLFLSFLSFCLKKLILKIDLRYARNKIKTTSNMNSEASEI